jgi:pimeloyl-ACP methyl ester carboxylesterase
VLAETLLYIRIERHSTAMERHVVTTDQLAVHYELTGTGDTALVFVHGWLGNARWWDAQRDFFRDRYTVVQIDLPGHGASDKVRTSWSAAQYADDIKAVADQLTTKSLVLVGHSMSGAYVALAAPHIANTTAVVLIDTLKNLDQLPTRDRVDSLLALYRSDFRAAVETVLPQFLFSPHTPPHVRARLQAEFLQQEPLLAVQIIEPLYRMDVCEAARRVAVPVRAINADFSPTDVEANRRYFRNYASETIAQSGHYPMLERPDELSRALDRVLVSLGGP